MKKNILYKTLALALVVTSLWGCLPKDDNTYDMDPVVEFKNTDFGVASAELNRRGVYSCAAQTELSRTINQNAIAVGSLSCSATSSANAKVTDTVLVQLIGEQRSTPTVINYAINASSTAVEGTNYTLKPAGARSVTIPANSSFGYIIFDVNNALTTAGTSAKVVFDLLGNDEVKASTNYKQFTVTIRRN
jgi:hypothetical protein